MQSKFYIHKNSSFDSPEETYIYDPLNDYNNDIEKEHKELHYKLLELHKEQDKVLSSIVNSRSSERNIKKQLRQKNKSYYYYNTLEKRQSTKTINHLKKSFFIE